MDKGVSKEVLAGFIEESKGYLPSILEGIKSCKKNMADSSSIEEAYRQIHIIKGASAMVGLSGLSQVAYYAEEILAEITENRLHMSEERKKLLFDMTRRIGDYLDSILNGSANEEYFLGESTIAYRRLRGLPTSGDDKAVKEALAKYTASLEENEEKEAETEDVLLFEEDFSLEDKEDTHQKEINPELLEIFSTEAEEHLRSINTLLPELEKDPEQKDLLQDIRRSVHTLKGAAGAVGFKDISKLAHRMEDLLDLLYEGGCKLDSEKMDVLFISADTLEDLAVGNERNTQELYSRYSTLFENIPSNKECIPGTEEGQASVDSPGNTTNKCENTDKTLGPKSHPKQHTAQVVQKKRDMLRVPLDRLDELVRLVSELVITRTTFEQHMKRFIHDTVDELNPSIERLQRVSSNLESRYEVSSLGNKHGAYDVQSKTGSSFNADEFDELEFDRYTEFHQLSRELVETSGDIKVLSSGINATISDFESVLNRQALLSSEIQDKLMRIRMIPMATLATRLRRTVRILAGEQNKLVKLVFEGENTEFDKTMLEEISDPLMHILRNAVDHGIESPEVRRAIKKPEEGCIHLKTFNDGNSVVIQISDDGTGLNAGAIRSKAVNGGYITEADVVRLSEEELYALIFLPGFSTAGKITEVSGRGVGMDVVKTNIEKLKGSITLDSVAGQGTVFTMRLPMTLAITRALLVGIQGKLFAIPTDFVTQIMRVETSGVEYIDKKPVIRVENQVYSLLDLGDVLNIRKSSHESVNHIYVLILSIGENKVALTIDIMHGEHEIVVKTLGNHLRRVHGITGATIMGDGSTVLILNPMELFEDLVNHRGSSTWTFGKAVKTAKSALDKPKPSQSPELPPEEKPAAESQKKRKGEEPHKGATTVRKLNVLVVDDSVSVRRVISSLINSANWNSIPAKDGLDALEKIQSSKCLPDAILLDVEMPRMDGYELLSRLRGQELYKKIPIIMLTSRSGKKHRKKAMDLGASEYIVKPCQKEVLISTVRRSVEKL